MRYDEASAVNDEFGTCSAGLLADALTAAVCIGLRQQTQTSA